MDSPNIPVDWCPPIGCVICRGLLSLLHVFFGEYLYHCDGAPPKLWCCILWPVDHTFHLRYVYPWGYDSYHQCKISKWLMSSGFRSIVPMHPNHLFNKGHCTNKKIWLLTLTKSPFREKQAANCQWVGSGSGPSPLPLKLDHGSMMTLNSLPEIEAKDNIFWLHYHILSLCLSKYVDLQCCHVKTLQKCFMHDADQLHIKWSAEHLQLKMRMIS